MTAFVHFIFVVIGFSVLFHFIERTDPATMIGHKQRLNWILAYEALVLIWAGWLLWGDA